MERPKAPVAPHDELGSFAEDVTGLVGQVDCEGEGDHLRSQTSFELLGSPARARGPSEAARCPGAGAGIEVPLAGDVRSALDLRPHDASDVSQVPLLDVPVTPQGIRDILRRPHQLHGVKAALGAVLSHPPPRPRSVPMRITPKKCRRAAIAWEATPRAT